MKKILPLLLLCILGIAKAQNHAPVAIDDTITIAPYDTTLINVLANDTDTDNDTLCIQGLYGSLHFSIADCANIIFRADSSFTGTDTCYYVICDNGTPALCDTGTLVVRVKSCLPEIEVGYRCQFGEINAPCFGYAYIKGSHSNADSIVWHLTFFGGQMIDTFIAEVDTLILSYYPYYGENAFGGIAFATCCLTGFNSCGSTTKCENVDLYGEGITELPGSHIAIYPNPAAALLNIKAIDFQPTQILVLDMAGRTVIAQKFSSQLNIASLNSGLYYIELSNKDAVVRKKLLK